MFKPYLALRLSIPLAVVAAGGAIVASIAVADYTPPAYLDTQTFIIRWDMFRQAAGVIACAGTCRTAQAGGANAQRCRLVEAAQASASACLTQLNTDCTPQNVLTCASGQP